MPPKQKNKGTNFSLPHPPAVKETVHDRYDSSNSAVGEEQKEEDEVIVNSPRASTGSNHIVFQMKPKPKPEVKPAPKRAADIGDVSNLGLGFDGREHDFSGMMKLIINNVLVTQHTFVSQASSTPSLHLTESSLRVVIVPNEIVGMATSDAKYIAAVVKGNPIPALSQSGKHVGPDGSSNNARERRFTKILEGNGCPTLGLALQSLLWKSVVGVASYVDFGIPVGEQDEAD